MLEGLGKSITIVQNHHPSLFCSAKASIYKFYKKTSCF